MSKLMQHFSKPLPTEREKLSLGLSKVQLVGLTAIFWGVVALNGVFFSWMANGTFNAPIILRPVLADIIGALLALALGLISQTRKSVKGVVVVAFILSFVATLIYAITSYILIAPIWPQAEDYSVTIQIIKMISLNYWIYGAWTGLFLIFELRLLNIVFRPDDQRLMLESIQNRQSGAPEGTASDFKFNNTHFWILQIGFWTYVVIFNILLGIISESQITVDDLVRIFATKLFGMLIMTGAHYFIFTRLKNVSTLVRGSTVMLTAIILLPLYVAGNWVVSFGVVPIGLSPVELDFPVNFELFKTTFPRWMLTSLALQVTWAALYLASDFAQRIRYQEGQLYRSLLFAQETQLKMLQFQLNPHFLFNTLNAISSLVLEGRNSDAEKMLLLLSKFLRFTLSTSPTSKLPLIEEVAAQSLYLDIEKVRFSERLNIVIDIEKDVEHALIPSLILQPLVENSVKYAVAVTSKPVTITIKAKRDGDNLLVEVRDDGPGNPPSSSSGFGVGLSNTSSRLRVLYGSAALFHSSPMQGNGYVSLLQLPLEV